MNFAVRDLGHNDHPSGIRLQLWAIVPMMVSCFASASHGQSTPVEPMIPTNDPEIEIIGRYDAHDAAHPRFGYPGAGIIFRFQGTEVHLICHSDSDHSALTVVVDHGAPGLRLLQNGDNQVAAASKLEDGPHSVEIYKRTETWQGVLTIDGIRLTDGSKLLAPPPLPARKLMFIGDSVTCGAGVSNNAQCKPDSELPANNAYESYGMLLGRRLDAQTQLVCYGGRGIERDYRGLGVADGVLNAPQFAHLSIPTDSPDARAAWDASRWQPDAIVVSLGTNDFNLQKTKPLDQKKWIDEYVAFVKDLRKDYPHASIFLTEGAIVTDPLLRHLVQQTVTQANDARVKYIASQHYPGNGCDAHPTKAQQIAISDDLEPVIRQAMGW